MSSDLECIHINGHKFTGSTSARRMFSIEYMPQPARGRETDQLVVIAKDIAEAVSIAGYRGFKEKIGNITEMKDLGTVIDMEIVKQKNVPSTKELVNSGVLIPEKRSRFDGIETKR